VPDEGALDEGRSTPRIHDSCVGASGAQGFASVAWTRIRARLEMWQTARVMPSWDDVERIITGMEEHQRAKVLDLARRLRPGLTLEDIKNPHDFPELADADWHYADGVLTGIEEVLAALRAARREGRP
jgi:hypothetical protein